MFAVAGLSVKNPFSPSFGTTPPLLAGRDGVIERFVEAVATGPTHPDYTLLVTGDRGTGKTAVLNALEAVAAERGWLTITAAASSESLSSRITGEAERCIRSLSGGRRRARLKSVSALGVGVGWETDSGDSGGEPSLLTLLERLGDMLTERGKGLLLTVDEMHDVSRDEVRNVAAAVQIVTRRRLRPLAFAAAALPLIEHTHLADPNMTFLQRCARAPLGPLTPAETRRALHEPITRNGRAIDQDALAEAVDATLGYPYMIQLVGFHAWRGQEAAEAPISLTNVRAGILEAEQTMVDQIAGPVWNRLSTMDKRFLVAMLADPDDSALADVAARLGRSLQYARTYRRRLAAAGALSPASKGRVRFRHNALRRRAADAARDDPALS